LEQGKFLFGHIRIDGVKPVTKVRKIFTASKDGWCGADFHKICDNMGPTLSLFRSTENYLSAGFASKSWDGTSTTGLDVEDASAMVFALTNNL